ncbi:MAG: ChaN family lipoprotein [Pseudomonadota bacterium]
MRATRLSTGWLSTGRLSMGRWRWLAGAAAAGLLLGTVAGAVADKPPSFTARFYAPEAEALGLQEWLDAVGSARPDVIYLGERHDSEAHHALQSAVVAGLEARFEAEGGVAGLVFEMIAEAKEPAALRARGWPGRAGPGASDAVAEAAEWDKSGWPDFALYAPILEAAPGAYVAGGGYPRQAVMRAATDADWLRREPGAARFGLDQPLPTAQQAAREAAQIASHCNAIPPEVAPMMVDAQRARDARLAAAILRAREAAAAEGRTGPVVVITGALHARLDYGAPALLTRAAPNLSQLSVAMVEREEPLSGFEIEPARAALFDVWAPTPPPAVERPDPCLAFKANRTAKTSAEETAPD